MKKSNFPYVIFNHIYFTKKKIFSIFSHFVLQEKKQNKNYVIILLSCMLLETPCETNCNGLYLLYVFVSSLPFFTNFSKYEIKLKIHLTCTQTFWNLFPKDCCTSNTYVNCCFLQGCIRQSSDYNILTASINARIVQEKFELWIFLFQLEFRSNSNFNIPVIYDLELFLTKEN